MIFIIRLLCPEGHMMAAGTCEADTRDETLLKQSFVNFLHFESPVMTCEEACYEIDLRTESAGADLNVRVEESPFQTLDESAASLQTEAEKIRRQEFLRRSRN